VHERVQGQLKQLLVLSQGAAECLTVSSLATTSLASALMFSHIGSSAS